MKFDHSDKNIIWNPLYMCRKIQDIVQMRKLWSMSNLYHPCSSSFAKNLIGISRAIHNYQQFDKCTKIILLETLLLEIIQNEAMISNDGFSTFWDFLEAYAGQRAHHIPWCAPSRSVPPRPGCPLPKRSPLPSVPPPPRLRFVRLC